MRCVVARMPCVGNPQDTRWRHHGSVDNLVCRSRSSRVQSDIDGNTGPQEENQRTDMWVRRLVEALLLAGCTAAGPREHAVTKAGPTTVTMAIGEVLALTITGKPTTG